MRWGGGAVGDVRKRNERDRVGADGEIRERERARRVCVGGED